MIMITNVSKQHGDKSVIGAARYYKTGRSRHSQSPVTKWKGFASLDLEEVTSVSAGVEDPGDASLTCQHPEWVPAKKSSGLEHDDATTYGVVLD